MIDKSKHMLYIPASDYKQMELDLETLKSELKKHEDSVYASLEGKIIIAKDHYPSSLRSSFEGMQFSSLFNTYIAVLDGTKEFKEYIDKEIPGYAIKEETLVTLQRENNKLKNIIDRVLLFFENNLLIVTKKKTIVDTVKAILKEGVGDD